MYSVGLWFLEKISLLRSWSPGRLNSLVVPFSVAAAACESICLPGHLACGFGFWCHQMSGVLSKSISDLTFCVWGKECLCPLSLCVILVLSNSLVLLASEFPFLESCPVFLCSVPYFSSLLSTWSSSRRAYSTWFKSSKKTWRTWVSLSKALSGMPTAGHKSGLRTMTLVLLGVFCCVVLQSNSSPVTASATR